MRMPFFRSYLCNDRDLVDLVLKQRAHDFPKSERIRVGLQPLLGNSVFISTGEIWAHQRRIIDPAFETEEMIDQVAIFFLAGHETSAAVLAWALYLLARYPDWQDKLAAEAQAAFEPEKIYFSTLSKLRHSRAVFRETMRLYPPVPMYVREATQPEQFRGRQVKRGSQVILNPWHLHRLERLWDRPDEFDPARFETPNGKECLRKAYIPFSAGPRVCPGSAFAMAEGPFLLSMLVRAYRFAVVDGDVPVPTAQLTVRSGNGIHLRLTRRQTECKKERGS